MDNKGYPAPTPGYPAPNSGYPAPSPPGYPVTVAPTTVIAPQLIFGEHAMQVTCGNCRQTVVTTTVAENGACAYIAAVITFILCCPCFWVPLVMDSCKDVTHSCPACGSMLGQYKRM